MVDAAVHEPSSAGRGEAPRVMQEETLAVSVNGGGVTCAGIALDAATRGLRTGVIGAQDWASGTSSRSSRLVHGVRYLHNLGCELVEALTDWGRLLMRCA